MKALIFLVVLAAVFSLFFWRLKKSNAEEQAARHKAIEARKKKDQEKITPDMDMVWPVIVKPVTGKRPPGEEAKAEEPSMTTIEFEPTDRPVAQ